MIKKAILEDIEWEYCCSNCNGKYSITFLYPAKLTATTNSKDVYVKLDNENTKEILIKLKSAIKAKYDSKLTDSFHTKFRTFFFIKFLEKGNLEEYIKDINLVKDDFKHFRVTKSKADCLSSQYYQKEESEYVSYKKFKKTVSDITYNLFDYDENQKRTYKKPYAFDMTHDDYRSSANKKDVNIIQVYQDLKKIYGEGEVFTLAQFSTLILEHSCTYCGINIKDINALGKAGKLHNKRSETRGYTLEIDRKEPNLEYNNDNCCISCYWCNNAKTDEYIPCQFKEIARGINAEWNRRLKLIDKNKNILFKDTAKIWKMDECE